MSKVENISSDLAEGFELIKESNKVSKAQFGVVMLGVFSALSAIAFMAIVLGSL
jgi:hypothetical protein